MRILKTQYAAISNDGRQVYIDNNGYASLSDIIDIDYLYDTIEEAKNIIKTIQADDEYDWYSFNVIKIEKTII